MDKNKLKNLLIENAKIRKLGSSNNIKSPTIVEMARSLSKTTLDTVKLGMSGQRMSVSTDEANRRRSICDICPAYNKPQQRCTKCGCFIAVKAYLRASSCPLGKW
jgi:formamidopyrimidine-DNA glycosylase